MRVERKDIKNLIFMRLNPGDDLLAAIKEGVEKNGIKNAVILSGVGSVISHSYHVVASSVNPPKNEFIKGERPADIVNIDGFVINGRVHAHIIFSDTNIAYGGHLESGVEILTFALLTMAEVDANFDKYDSVGKIEDLLP
ncbi:MAG: DNA-binding protein [Treponema sp.]|jgi:predicted DNA-binding protein with PD1-like motif|nr:DNA-binding protein [Treponema sp.]